MHAAAEQVLPFALPAGACSGSYHLQQEVQKQYSMAWLMSR